MRPQEDRPGYVAAVQVFLADKTVTLDLYDQDVPVSSIETFVS